MRDPVLYPFYADIGSLPGVGPKVKPVLARLIGGETLLDLIFHLPVNWIDRRNRATIASVDIGEVATVTGVVDKLDHARNKLPARIRLRDATGFITLSYFHANRQWLERTFKIGESVIASGTIGEYMGARQMAHPDHVVPADSDADLPEVEPVYPMTANLTPKALRKFIAAALHRLPDLDEWIDPHLLGRNHWPSFNQALCGLFAAGYGVEGRAARGDAPAFPANCWSAWSKAWPSALLVSAAGCGMVALSFTSV